MAADLVGTASRLLALARTYGPLLVQHTTLSIDTKVSAHYDWANLEEYVVDRCCSTRISYIRTLLLAPCLCLPSLALASCGNQPVAQPTSTPTAASTPVISIENFAPATTGPGKANLAVVPAEDQPTRVVAVYVLIVTPPAGGSPVALPSGAGLPANCTIFATTEGGATRWICVEPDAPTPQGARIISTVAAQSVVPSPGPSPVAPTPSPGIQETTSVPPEPTTSPASG